MKRGPKPSGKAMTAAQRQARYRAGHAEGAPRLRTAVLPTGAAWRSGGVMPWASSSICRAPIDHGPTACRRTLLIAPRRKRRAALGETAKLRYVTLLNVLGGEIMESRARCQ